MKTSFLHIHQCQAKLAFGGFCFSLESNYHELHSAALYQGYHEHFRCHAHQQELG